MLASIERKNNPLFISKTLLLSGIESLILTVICKLFSDLEHITAFSFSQIGADLMTTTIDNWLVMFFISILFNFGFYGLTFYKRNMELHKILAESQLKTLQAQINPHFMFNVLNHIDVLMRKDVELASELLVKYSEILRYQLYCGEKEQISISEEVGFLKSFVDVEKIRWKDKIDVICIWNMENMGFKLSPLLLIVFIENAFKHVSRSTSTRGYIHIELTQKGGTLQLNIENSKSLIPNEKNGTLGIGLDNITKRLDILYPKKYNLTIKDSDTIYCSKLIIKK